MNKVILILVGFGLLIITTTVFISCSKSDIQQELNEYDTSTFKPAIKKLNFIGHWLNEGKKEKLVRDLAREYEFLNQELLVNLKFPEEVYYDRGQGQSQQKFVAKILSQEIPEWDIIRIEYPTVATYLNNPNWTKEHLVDFSEIEAYRKNTRPELLTDEYKNANWGGILPGPFIEGQYWSLFHNKNVAEKLGLEIKTTGMTISDFKFYCETVYKYNQANPGGRITTFFDANDWSTAGHIATQLFASQFNSLSEFRGAFTPDRLDKWYNVLKALEDISKFDIFPATSEYLAWGETNNVLMEGETLFYLNGSWMFNIWEQKDAEKVWDCVPTELPAFANASVYPIGYACTWGVLKNAPNRDEAIEFLLWINSSQTARDWVNGTKSPTGIKTSAINTTFGVDQFDDFSQYLTQKYAKGSYTSRLGAWDVLGEKNYKNHTYSNNVLRGQMTADEAIERIRQELK